MWPFAARWAALAAVLFGTLAVDATGAAVAATRAPFPSKDLTLTGHGLGPGYGLGQWGAFGLAVLDHFTYAQILRHYYSDTAHPVAPAILSAAADRQIVSVVIEENDGSAVTVTSPSAFTYTAGGKKVATVAPGHAGRAVEMVAHGAATGRWELESSPSCSSRKWTEVASGLTDPVAVPASQSPTAPQKDLLTLCRADGQAVTYRGRIEAYDYYGASTSGEHLERTLNLVPLEEYVAAVTPSESPAGWGAYGLSKGSPQHEAWGFQELEAQAIASRTYVLYSIADGGWYGYASICDDVCEYYAQGDRFETPLSTLATLDTAGDYLVQEGQPAPTEYSSSDGGYTETLEYWNGQSIFDAASDPGDQVCVGGAGSLGCNPWHTWTASITVATLEGDFPKVGTLASVKVTATDSSGRVVTISLLGTKGQAFSVSGATFASEFGLDSTLFAITDGPGASEAPTAGGVAAPATGAGRPGFRPPVGLPARQRLGGGRN